MHAFNYNPPLRARQLGQLQGNRILVINVINRNYILQTGSKVCVALSRVTPGNEPTLV